MAISSRRNARSGRAAKPRDLKKERLELRVSVPAKELILRAAEVSGLTAGDLAYEGARRVLDEHERMVLTGADRDVFLAALANPPAPAKRLIAALKRHRDLVGWAAPVGITIEPLHKRHDRTGFSSGEPELDEWFQKRASQDEKRNLARVFVALEDECVIGFYSISSFTLTIDDLPEELARKLPRYEALPAVLIGRLARDERVRGRGIGEVLLADAIRRILSAARSIAVFAILVDAKSDRVFSFYEAFGFRAFPNKPRRMFLVASTALAALGRV
jgi:uncharacterized protein (DUF1778 family)/GNAT superfamily N-acetyltransferase